MKTILRAFLALVTLLLVQRLEAQLPRPISFQGVLTDTLGKPKPDGPYDFQFKLYDTPGGGSAVWTEPRTLPVMHGLFSVMLGGINSMAGLDFAVPYWLGIQVGGAPEMMPRIQLSAGGFSYHARNAWRADQADSLTGGRIAPGSVVRSVNSITDNVKLTAGTNISIGKSHDTLTISAAGGGGFTLPYNDSASSSGSMLRVSNTGTGIGIWGVSKNGSGVQGNSDNGNGITGFSRTKNGVYGHTLAGSGFGVSGRNDSTGAWGFFGGTAEYHPTGVYGNGEVGILGTGLTGVAGRGSTDVYGLGVFGYAASGSGVQGMTMNGYGLDCDGAFRQQNGKFEASPTTTQWTTNKPATVKTNSGTKVKLFTEEAAELFFNDYGDGKLTNGVAHIELDPLFLQTVTVDATHPMKVFVQLEDDCKGMYVTHKTTTGFDVVELQGGTSNARFIYRVMCKRKYYEDERLATEEQDIQYNTRVLQTAWPEVIAERKEMEARLNSMRQKGGREVAP